MQNTKPVTPITPVVLPDHLANISKSAENLRRAYEDVRAWPQCADPACPWCNENLPE